MNALSIIKNPLDGQKHNRTPPVLIACHNQADVRKKRPDDGCTEHGALVLLASPSTDFDEPVQVGTAIFGLFPSQKNPECFQRREPTGSHILQNSAPLKAMCVCPWTSKLAWLFCVLKFCARRKLQHIQTGAQNLVEGCACKKLTLKLRRKLCADKSSQNQHFEQHSNCAAFHARGFSSDLLSTSLNSDLPQRFPHSLIASLDAKFHLVSALVQMQIPCGVSTS